MVKSKVWAGETLGATAVWWYTRNGVMATSVSLPKTRLPPL